LKTEREREREREREKTNKETVPRAEIDLQHHNVDKTSRFVKTERFEPSLARQDKYHKQHNAPKNAPLFECTDSFWQQLVQ
jgi:hypothetical protein